MIEYVDPFIGADTPGHCLCGPYLPLSLVRLGPDTLYPQATSGYQSKVPISHFSHTHVSGTGGGARYGNVGVKPFVGIPRFILGPYEREDERAQAGYYAVTLQPDGIRAELTVTPRVGVHRYTFPDGADANILIDLGCVVQIGGASHRMLGYGTGASIGGYIEWITDNEVVGRGDYRGGWGHDFPYSVYFYARFDVKPTQRGMKSAVGMTYNLACDGVGSGAIAHFGTAKRIGMLVGISYVSIAHARASVDREVGSACFDDISARAAQTWEKALSRISVQGGTDEQRKLFYSLFTRLICMPSDLGIDDENPLWRSGVRHFTDYYCLWDSARNANSLISLFDPKLEVDMLNCLLDVADHIGWLPDAWIAGHSAMIQGGSSADMLICEAALKGLEGIDYEKALLQMRKNNEVESPDPWLYGRHLKDYRDLGYVSTDVRKACVSRHLEYTYQDWCIGRLAERLGQHELADRYYQSSRKVWNLWRDDLKSFAPRKPDGQWLNPFDPTTCIPDSWNDPFFYEGKGVQWSFNVQHDFAGLISRHGGAEAFVRHLDWFFEADFYRSHETLLHIPYLYNYAGRPDRTAQKVRWAMQKFYKPKRNALSDNEDMGCLSAFYMCSAIGLYPIMGQDIWLLTSPVFERTEIDLGLGGRPLVIEAPGAGEKNIYIRSAKINGQELGRAWIRHGEIAGGGTIRYELSDKPAGWGEDSPPPSPLSAMG